MSIESLVPNRLLFHFEFTLRYRPSPVIDGDLSDWTDAHRLPDFSAIDGEPSFASLWLAWNETGLFLACRVAGRSGPLQCDPKAFWKGDNIRLMTDMRDTRDLKRASRYCQQWYFLPSGGGTDGRQPVAGAAPVNRAAEKAPPVPAGLVTVASRQQKQGYTLEAHIPAEALSGFDPQEHRRIGVFTMVEDRSLGQQYLTVGDELNWNIDPSTWATGVLDRDA